MTKSYILQAHLLSPCKSRACACCAAHNPYPVARNARRFCLVPWLCPDLSGLSCSLVISQADVSPPAYTGCACFLAILSCFPDTALSLSGRYSLVPGRHIRSRCNLLQEPVFFRSSRKMFCLTQFSVITKKRQDGWRARYTLVPQLTDGSVLVTCNL